MLYTFGNADEGWNPAASLTADAAGDLYGTTTRGGAHNAGEVFELEPPQAGRTAWSFVILYAFAAGKDGSYPISKLLPDGAGNLYWTTRAGGSGGRRPGQGTVFELSPPAQGQTAWTETQLYSFNPHSGKVILIPSDGGLPEGDLIADAAGNLYGTAVGGGPGGGGVAFELSPPPAGQTAWAYTILYAFGGHAGAGPFAGLIADGAGNVYGTTQQGGANNDGVVFELSPPAQGKTAWTETVLHAFSGPDGSGPQNGLIADAAGNLYGTTPSGGANGQGVGFELKPPARGQTTWTEKVLASFDGTDGAQPLSSLISDGAGGFYGTTLIGGRSNDGVVFQLKR